MHTYFNPWNAGLASETGAACRRMSRLLNALADEINANIAQGTVVSEIHTFTSNLITKLRADGWKVEPTAPRGWKVSAPKGSRK